MPERRGPEYLAKFVVSEIERCRTQTATLTSSDAANPRVPVPKSRVNYPFLRPDASTIVLTLPANDNVTTFALSSDVTRPNREFPLFGSPAHGSDGNGAMVLNLLSKPEEALVFQTVSPLILRLSLFLMTAVATHFVMSFGQTLLHYKVAHHPIGGKLFRYHINFHHTHYADDHLVSRTYLGDEGNITPYFFIPVFLVGGCAYFLLPPNLFVVMVIASAASFCAHVFLDKEYHAEGSWLQRFAWFRRRQELHFVHHRHGNSNFGIIHFFWDKILGTYRTPNADA